MIHDGELNQDVLRLYDNKNEVSSKGGLVVVWCYSSASDEIFVASSLCSPQDYFNKKEGKEKALERFNELFYTTKPVDTNLSFVISNKKLMEYLEEVGILVSWSNTFSDNMFEKLIYKPIDRKFSKKFVHDIILATIAELWHERYDKNYNLVLNHKGAMNEKLGV